MSSSETGNDRNVSASEYEPSESTDDFSQDEGTTAKVNSSFSVKGAHGGTSVPVQRPKRLSRVPEKWTRTERKKRRNTGLTYVGVTGKQIRERKLGGNCSCTSKCMQTIGKAECKIIFSSFWALGDFSVQNAYLAGLVNICEVRRKTKKGESKSRRNTTMKYKVSVNGFDKQVCKQAFLLLHSISNGRLMRLLKKKVISGSPGIDMRGKHSVRPNKCTSEDIEYVKVHINSIPKQSSHYSRAKSPHIKYLPPELNITKLYGMYKETCVSNNKTPVTAYRYRYIFNHDFNLSFGPTKQATCKECDRLNTQITSTYDDEDKKKLKLELNVHQQKAEEAYKAFKQDSERSKDDPSTVLVCFDLQQALPTPVLHTSVVFYKRQLWCYNLGIHNMGTGEAHMFLWCENEAGRGADEIMSCIMKFVSNLSSEVRNLILYSDSCSGQNKNFTAVAVFSHFVQCGRFDSVEHKFLVSGHTFMPCDRDFGLIEKEKRKLQYLFLPDEWVDVIKRSSRKFKVHRMKRNDFLDFSSFHEKVQKRNVAEDGVKVEFRNAMIIRMHKEAPNKFFIKWSHSDRDPFKCVDMNKVKRGRPSVCAKQGLPLMDIQPQQKYFEPRAIQVAKFKDLQSLLQFVPPAYHYFYNSLVHSNVTAVAGVEDNILDYED